MHDESGSLGFAASAVSISEGMFLTAAATLPPRRAGNNVFISKIKLATYTIGARKPVKILKDLGDLEL